MALFVHCIQLLVQKQKSGHHASNYRYAHILQGGRRRQPVITCV